MTAADTPMNLAAYLLQNTAGLDKDVIAGPDEKLSYAELSDQANRISFFIAGRFGPGERIGIFSDNAGFFIAAYLGILKAGCVTVMLDTNAPRKRMIDEITRTDIRHVFVQNALVEKLSGIGLDTVTEDVLEAVDAEEPPSGFDGDYRGAGDDLAVIFFTSGTMAKRKGVMLSHRNIIANTESIAGYLGLAEGDRSCLVLPMHYAGGTAVLHTHVRVGASLVLFNTTLSGTIIDGINQFQCTNLAGVPTTYSILLRRGGFTRHRYPTLRFVAQAGGAMASSMIEELRQGLPGTDVYVMYGQTEASARLSYLPPDRLAEKLGSIGRGIPGTELRVIGDDGQPVKAGDAGEIIARGDNIMLGYLDDPEATRKTVRGGWLHTNDLATVDDEGFIYIIGRMDDVIKSAGYRVSPTEIEDLILSHPGVTQCGVIGVEDSLLGQAIVVYIGAEDASRNLPPEIEALCRKNLPFYMRPKHIHVSPSLPLNASLKLDRAALRERASAEFSQSPGDS